MPQNEMKAELPKEIRNRIKWGTKGLAYYLVDDGIVILAMKNEYIPFALALIGEADLEKLLAEYHERAFTNDEAVEYYLCKLYIHLKKKEAAALEQLKRDMEP